MGALELSLIAAALLVGFTGTWSPCGFSMIETIGPTGHSGGRPTTFAACVTFFLGCLAGGVATFAALAALGSLVHGAGGRAAYLLAAALALAAAAAEARGTRIAPQVRRQLPEHWRWLMPMPLAAGLYGILLGLGFTTFVLTFGVWALMGIAFAVGEPLIGVAIGLAFGVGRGAPIIALAPIADRPFGARCTEAMAVRPRLYRGARLGDAAALALAAAVLVGVEPASGSSHIQTGAADPSTQARVLAWQEVGGSDDRAAWVRRGLGEGGQTCRVRGNEPAIGGGRIAVLAARTVEVRDLNDPGYTGDGACSGPVPEPRMTVGSERTDAVAISRNWIVYRIREDGQDRLVRRAIRTNSFGPARVLERVGRRAQIGQPDLSGNLLVYALARPQINRIIRQRLGGGGGGVVLSSRQVGLSNPSVLNRGLTYVRTNRQRHQLMVKSIGNNNWGRSLFSRTHDQGTLWSTALGPNHAFVTILRGSGNPPDARVRRFSR